MSKLSKTFFVASAVVLLQLLAGCSAPKAAANARRSPTASDDLKEPPPPAEGPALAVWVPVPNESPSDSKEDLLETIRVRARLIQALQHRIDELNPGPPPARMRGAAAQTPDANFLQKSSKEQLRQFTERQDTLVRALKARIKELEGQGQARPTDSL